MPVLAAPLHVLADVEMPVLAVLQHVQDHVHIVVWGLVNGIVNNSR